MGIQGYRVLDADGNTKREVSAEEATVEYWKRADEEDGFKINIMENSITNSESEKHDYKCIDCNKPFTAKGYRKYCHNPCFDSKKHKLYTVSCRKCKKEFTTLSKKRRYCHSPCTFHYTPVSNNSSRNCLICGIEFIGNTLYCQNPCIHQYTKRVTYKPWKPGDPVQKPILLRKWQSRRVSYNKGKIND